MIYYDLGDGVQAFSTNIGEECDAADVITPAYQAHSTTVALIPDEINATFGVDALSSVTIASIPTDTPSPRKRLTASSPPSCSPTEPYIEIPTN